MTWSSFGGDLVALHGGRIEARSAGRGLGSEFVVRLPLSGERPAITEAVAKPERVTALGAGAVRVLVVDDNVDAASSLSQVLATAGYQTSVAHEGSRALELARQLLPAVVLLDIGLPDLSGHDIARRLRAEPWGEDMQLIAITGWGQESDRQQSIDASFDEHFTKPIDPGVLLQRIARAVRGVA